MIQLEMGEIPEAPDSEDAPTLTADELSLVTSTPQPERALDEIDEHLRDLGLYSDK